MDRGYLKLFTVKGVPVRAHWTVLIAIVIFSGVHRGEFHPLTAVGVLFIILLHELGHAFVVNRVGLVNAGIDLTGIGGVCKWVGNPRSRIDRALVAWGGVAAQATLLAIAWPVYAFAPLPESVLLDDVFYALIEVNMFLIAFNLIPIPPFDGAKAWPLFKYLREDRARKQKWKRKLTPREPKEPQTLKEALKEADDRRG